MYPNIAAVVFNEPWVILTEKMEAIAALIQLRMNGGKVSEEDVKAVVAASQAPEIPEFSGYLVAAPTYGTAPDGDYLRHTSTAARWILPIGAHKHKDATGRYLWACGQNAGQPDTYAANAAASPSQPTGQAVAVIPMFGTLSQHAGKMQQASGGTSTEEFSRDFRRAIADPQIGSIILHVHSPGGSVYGVEEAANLVYEGRQKKPVVAAVNSVCASGAYWIASQCSQIAVTPGGEVGSIGVISAHQDVSKAQEAEGVKTTLVAIPAKKAQLSPYGPLSGEAVAELQSRNQATYEKFTGQVARGRGVPHAKAKSSDFGGGGMLKAEGALAGGMVDKIATLDQVISAMLAGNAGGKMGRNRAALALAELD